MFCSKFVSLFTFTFAFVNAAWAQGTLRWTYDQTNFIVSPTETITINATITSSLSTNHLITENGGSFSGDLQKKYHYSGWESILGKEIPSNGTLRFFFGSLSPIDGFVEPGIYNGDEAWINFGPDFELIFPDNTFQITVVPEPTPYLLLTLGGVVYLLFRRRAAR